MNTFCYGQQLPEPILNKWQKIANLLSTICTVPIACVTRLIDNDFSVITTTDHPKNPLTVSHIGCLQGSNVYCEKAINDDCQLAITDASTDEHWMNSPVAQLGAISYLGEPIKWPDGRPFGTLCILDTQQKEYTQNEKSLLSQFIKIIQSDLELMYMNAILGEGYTSFQDCLEEIKKLRSDLAKSQKLEE